MEVWDDPFWPETRPWAALKEVAHVLCSKDRELQIEREKRRERKRVEAGPGRRGRRGAARMVGFTGGDAPWREELGHEQGIEPLALSCGGFCRWLVDRGDPEESAGWVGSKATGRWLKSRRGGWKDWTDPEEGGDQVEKSVGGGERRTGWIGRARARG